MGNDLLAPCPMVSIVPPQAGSDDDMVDLWLGNFRSPHTRRGYAIDIRAFRAFAPIPLAAVTVRVIQSFSASLEHLAPATVSRRLSAVKSLVAMAHRLGYLAFDVGGPIQLPAIKDTLSERILSEWQVQRMLEMVRRPRDAALLRVAYGLGLRISEVCGLRWRDLTERGDTGQATIFGKGGKTRTILMAKPLWDRVQPLRGKAGPDDYVFRSRWGGGLDPSRVHQLVKAAAKRAGLPAAVSCHWLRHSACSHALTRGAPVHVVQASLGHCSLTTTTRYSHSRPDDSISRYLTA
jgi:integrase/recombinase XerD